MAHCIPKCHLYRKDGKIGLKDAIQENLHPPKISPDFLPMQNFIAERASGSYIYSTDGQKHLDMAAGTVPQYAAPCFVSILYVLNCYEKSDVRCTAYF